DSLDTHFRTIAAGGSPPTSSRAFRCVKESRHMPGPRTAPRPTLDIKVSRSMTISAVCGLISGTAGFVCGYFGTCLLAANPSNIMPVFGMGFGPLGLVLGGTVGAVGGFIQARRSVMMCAMVLVTLCTSALALAFTAPGYVPVTELVEARVVSSDPPA